MSTLSQEESCETLALRLEASDSVTERLNGSLLRGIELSLIRQLGVGLSKRRLLFVPREHMGPEKSYVLASFIDSDTYEFILVSQGVMQRADRCSSAIRVEVLSGFLLDLVSLEISEPEVASEAAEDEVIEAPPVPETVVAPQSVLADGWIMPAPSEFL